MPRLAAFGPSTEPKPHLRVTSTEARCDFRYDQVTGVPSRCLATRSIICAAIEATTIHRFGQAVGDPTREGHCRLAQPPLGTNVERRSAAPLHRCRT